MIILLITLSIAKWDGMNFKRLEYTVNTDITTTIAYTQEGDADWMDVFEESALTIRIGE